MIYCLNTFTNKEELIIDLINKELKDVDYPYSIFTPKKIELVKFKGKWQKEEKILFPSYIFIDTSNINDIYNHLYNIPSLTKLLGIDKKRKEIVPLFNEEEELIYSLMNKDNNNHTIDLSLVEILENKNIKVLKGPLKDLMGKVIKVDLHKRRVTVLLPLLGQLVETSLGIDIVSPLSITEEIEYKNRNEQI